MGVTGLWDVSILCIFHLISHSHSPLTDSSSFWEIASSHPSRCRGWIRGEPRQFKGSPHWYRCIHLVLSRCIRKRRRESGTEDSFLPLCTPYERTVSPTLHLRRSQAAQSQTWEEGIWRKTLAGRWHEGYDRGVWL